MHGSAVCQLLMGWNLTDGVTRLLVLKAGMGFPVLQLLVLDLI